MNKKTRLSEIGIGDCTTVHGIVTEGSMRRRLLDIGLTPGTRVVCIGKSPFGDPRLYYVRGSRIALRNRDADGIITE